MNEVSPRDYHTRLTCNREDIFAVDSWLSKSVLWELKNASLYQWRFSPATFKGSAAADWGTMLDCLVTTPDEIDSIVAIHEFPNFRTKEAKEWRDEQVENGLIVMREEEMDDVRKAAERMMANRDAAEIIGRSGKQVVLLSQLEGVNFKGLVDLAPVDRPYLADIKTTGKWSHREFEKTIGNLGYHVQAAVYLALWNKVYPDDKRDRFRLIWQQSFAPYEVTVTELPAVDLTCGEEFAGHLLSRLIVAAKRNWWPNLHGDKVVMCGAPAYSHFEMEEIMEGPMDAPGLQAPQPEPAEAVL